MNELIGLIGIAIAGFIMHITMLNILMPGNRGFAGDCGSSGDDDENTEEAFVEGLFGEKTEKKSNSIDIDADGALGDEEDEVFGRERNKAIDYDGDEQGSGDDKEGEEELPLGSEKAKKADLAQDKKGNKPGEKNTDPFADVDFNTLTDDSLIDMIADDKYTVRERGLLKEMHNDRRKRQEALALVDHYKLALRAKDLSGNKKEENEEEEDSLDKVFEGKEDDDFMSVADVKRVLQKQQEIKEKQNKKIQTQIEQERERHAQQMQQYDSIEKSLKTQHDDYEDMMRCAAVAMQEEPLFAEKMNNIAASGGDPVSYCYKLGKKFSPLYLEAIKKGSQNKDANEAGKKGTQTNNAQRMADNAKKKKTSASLGSGGANTSQGVDIEALDAMDLDDLVLTLHKMPTKLLLKVPRRIKDRALA